jgi:4-aminobutyrate aminotransferase-like enzyme
VFPALCMRLCMSFLLAIETAERDPGNDYITIGQTSVRAALLELRALDPQLVHDRLRQVCGWPARQSQGAGKGSRRGEILERRARVLGPSLSVAYREPLKIVRGDGAYLFDDRGRGYVDCVNNVCHVGHCHPEVVRAAQSQIAVLNTNTRYLHDHVVEYAERLGALFPDPLSVCFFVCSGSEANELAVRLARAHTDRQDMVVLDVGYHGNTTTLVELSAYKHAGPGGAGKPDFVHVAALPDGDRTGADGARFADSVREALDRASVRGGAAAFLVESISGCGGQVEFPQGYLQAAFGHARAAGAVCIADEVQVGFGRVGSHMWAFETQGVVPDIVTLGKPIGNGHPMAAVITTPEIAGSFANGMEYFNTFGGNPVSCAIGLAVLDVIEREGLQDHARIVGERLLEGFGSLPPRFPILGDVRGRGLFVGVEMVRDRLTREPAAAELAEIVERMKDAGFLLSADGRHHNVLKCKPPMSFSLPNAELLLAVFARVLETVTPEPATGWDHRD